MKIEIIVNSMDWWKKIIPINVSKYYYNRYTKFAFWWTFFIVKFSKE